MSAEQVPRLVREIQNHLQPGHVEPATKPQPNVEGEDADHQSKKVGSPVWIVKWTGGWAKFAPWPGYIEKISDEGSADAVYDVRIFT